jgi:uncharacterized RDD family membrane protein YckC
VHRDIEGVATRAPTARRHAADPRDVVLGAAVVGVRATAVAARLALLPARVALRTPLLRGAAERLAAEGRASRRSGRTRLEAMADELLAAPGVDALGRSLAEHRVVERVAGPVLEAADVETAFAGALDDERTERLVEQALESRLTAQVTDRVLQGPELERIVEQVASSPALRAALAQQSTSLAGAIAARIRRRAAALDDAAERTARRWVRRAPRAGDGPVPVAGLATRGIGLGIDILIVHAIVLLGAGALALVASLVGDLRPAWLVALLVAVGWALSVAAYFVLFWSTAGQTPGMRAMRVRVVGETGEPPTVRRSVLRLVGLGLAIIPLFAGFLPVLVDDRRRGLHDYLAGSVVLYSEPVIRSG